jgi:uncharacterized membrane protein YvbJ
LSSLSNKTILHNEKTFKIIGSIILILIIAVVVFLYFEYSTTGRTTRSKSRNSDKIQAAINQTAWDSTAVSFSFRNHHYLWDKKT